MNEKFGKPFWKRSWSWFWFARLGFFHPFASWFAWRLDNLLLFCNLILNVLVASYVLEKCKSLCKFLLNVWNERKSVCYWWFCWIHIKWVHVENKWFIFPFVVCYLFLQNQVIELSLLFGLERNRIGFLCVFSFYLPKIWGLCWQKLVICLLQDARNSSCVMEVEKFIIILLISLQFFYVSQNLHVIGTLGCY